MDLLDWTPPTLCSVPVLVFSPLPYLHVPVPLWYEAFWDGKNWDKRRSAQDLYLALQTIKVTLDSKRVVKLRLGRLFLYIADVCSSNVANSFNAAAK